MKLINAELTGAAGGFHSFEFLLKFHGVLLRNVAVLVDEEVVVLHVFIYHGVFKAFLEQPIELVFRA